MKFENHLNFNYRRDISSVCLFLDVPFSLVADTILIPYDWPPPNPVEGWSACKEPAAIVDDYKAFIAEREWNHSILMGPYFYEDGTGRHAVKIEAETGSRNNAEYFIMYDGSNVRTKMIKGRHWTDLHM